jgi:hypothetical protein
MATISTAAANAACNAVVDLVDAGTPPGYIGFYATGGTRATHLHFANTAFGLAGASDSQSAGVARLAAGTARSATASATETIATARIQNAAGTNVISAITCASPSGGNINFSSLAVTAGDTVTLSALTVTMPTSS